jgi:hypothetical protein
MIFLTFKTCGVLEDGMLAPQRVGRRELVIRIRISKRREGCRIGA